MGMPLSSWKPKACGELSMMMVCARSRPSTAQMKRQGGGMVLGISSRTRQAGSHPRTCEANRRHQHSTEDNWLSSRPYPADHN